MAMYNGTMASIEEGEIVSAKVLDIRDNMVILDIGFKSEGTIPLEEFKDMPELSWPFGYPLAVTAMVLSAIAPLLWFRRKGWL